MSEQVLEKVAEKKTGKKKKSVIGFDPLAWLNEEDLESTDTVEVEIKTETVVDSVETAETPVNEASVDQEDVSPLLIESETQANEAIIDQKETTIDSPESNEENVQVVSVDKSLIETNMQAQTQEELSEEKVMDNTTETDKTILSLEGNVLIAETAEMHEKFKSVLEKNKDIQVDCSEVQSVDAAMLQLFSSFEHEATKKGLELTWKNPSESMFQAVRLLGLSSEIIFEF